MPADELVDRLLEHDGAERVLAPCAKVDLAGLADHDALGE
jgi:hypothetical protein